MRIAIHHEPGSFSDGWIEACRKRSIDYEIVDCRRSDIVAVMRDFDLLMWHWHHTDTQALLYARQLTQSLETMGKQVFPDVSTAWHFDDKLGQKYLLEAVGAPLVPAHIFYDRKTALDWCSASTFPKVFKLRNGAGSLNVRLVRNVDEASKLISQAFGRGFSPYNRLQLFKDRLRAFSSQKSFKSFVNLAKGFGRLFVPTAIEKSHGREKGYVYFQDFAAGNLSDTRVVVIGRKALAYKRGVRPGDFRASGSDILDYNPKAIDTRCLEVAFETSAKLGVKNLAYDFVFMDGEPRILEISYGYKSILVSRCLGYWDRELNWYPAQVSAEKIQLEALLEQS